MSRDPFLPAFSELTWSRHDDIRGPFTPPEQSQGVGWWLVEVAALSVAFAISQCLARLVATQDHLIVGLAPPLGLAFAVLWQRGLRLWPAIPLGAVLASLMLGTPLLVMLIIVFGDTIACLLAVWLTHEATEGRLPFQRSRDALLFVVLAAVVCCGVSAIAASLALYWRDLSSRDRFGELLAARWLARALGVLLVAPLVVAWWPPRSFARPSRKVIEYVIYGLVMLVIGVWTFGREIGGQSMPIPDAALVLPLGMWSAFRFGKRGNTVTTAAICVMSLFSAMEMRGPFGREGGVYISSNLLLAMGNSAVFAVSMLVISALTAERQSADIDIRKTDVRYRILFENSPDAVFVVDLATGELLEFNAGLPKLLKCQPDELRARNRYDFEVQDVEFHDSSSILSVLNPKTNDIDLQYRCFSGDVIDVHVTYSGIDYFGRAAHLMIARDVTARRQAEQYLRDSEERFRALAETMPAVVAIQRDGQSLYVNPAASELSGYSLDELQKLDFVDLLQPRDRDEARRQVERCMAQRAENWRREVVLRTKAGQKRHLDLSVTPLMLEGRAAWLASAVDITDRLAAEAEVQQLNAELFHSARLRLLGELVAGVAHDLRHAIGAIDHIAAGKLQEVQNGETLTADQAREAFETMLGLTRRAVDSLARVQDLARRHETDRRWQDVVPLITDAIRILRLDRRWQRVPIEIDAEDNRPRAYVDRAEVTQVFMDLIRNGLEAMADMPEKRRRMKIKVRCDEPGWLLASVTDYGPGVPEDFRLDLFKAFHTTKDEGMGLGLNLCQTIVSERHHGRLWFEPAASGGATFHVRLPAEKRA